MSQVLDAPPPTPALADEDLAALAVRHGLSVSGARPCLPQYARQLRARRHFISAFATAKATAQYSEAELGQICQVANPLLNAAVYYLVWTFTQRSIMAGTRAISGNVGLVRALHFPRAALPISLALQQFQQLLFSMVALVAHLLCFGIPVAMSWLLVFPVLTLQFIFNAGASMIVARIGAKTPDIAPLTPFLLRTWMYASGVMWSIDKTLKHKPYLLKIILESNPAAVYIDLMRYALIDSFKARQFPHHAWAYAVGWALLFGLGGFICFWKAEEEYGCG
ncbi:ABC transporter permease [Streptomyces sp. NPDC001852]|uniref:ABC transporter permease n=1 Tax=Streptomyces sp. NPDC001852 TaxID=3364619 RepID=UPI0036822736